MANNQYQAGIVAYLNVISAQTTVLSAQNNLNSVRNRRLTAVNTLLKNVAGRWEPLGAGCAKSERAVQACGLGYNRGSVVVKIKP